MMPATIDSPQRAATSPLIDKETPAGVRPPGRNHVRGVPSGLPPRGEENAAATATIAPGETIGLLFEAPVERAALSSLLAELGHTVLALCPRDGHLPGIERVSLVIVDEVSARAHGDLLLAAKERMRPIVVPILVALPPASDGLDWMRRGFDALLRLPARRNDVLARIGTFLRLRRQSEEALRTSEVFSRATLDAISANICVVDAAGFITLANRGWREFAECNDGPATGTCEGANYAEVCRLARSCAESDADLAATTKAMLDVLEGRETSCTFEYPCHSPSERRWFIASAVRFTNAGAPFTVISHTNVTARHESALASRQSEARFRSLVDLSSDFYWETDASHRMTRRTAGAGCRFPHRYGDVAVLGRCRWEVPYLTPDEAGWERHRADMDARRPFREFEFSRPDGGDDGRPCHYSVSGEPHFDEKGDFLGYRGVGTDISARKRGERLLAMEHTVSRSLSEAGTAADGIRAVAQAICEAELWDSGRYWALDDSRGRLRVFDYWCVADARIEDFLCRTGELVLSSDESAMAEVVARGEPVWIHDLARDPRTMRPDLVRATGLTSALLMPVFVESEVLGVFAFVGRKMFEPDGRLSDALRAICEQVGQFLRRKQSEDVLRESEARFRNLTSLSSDWYWETDENHRLTRISGRNFPDGVGTPAQWQGLPRWEGPGVDRDDPIWARHRATLDRREAFQDFEYRIVSVDGGDCWVSVSGYPASGADGAFLGYRGIARDITPRRQSDLVLRESEARFRELTVLSSDWYWEMDDRMRITYLSPGFEAQTGIGTESVLGRAPWDTTLMPTGASWEKRRTKILSHAPFRDDEVNFLDPKGHRRHLLLSGSPILDEEGAFRGYRGTGKNVTEKRQDEDRIKRFREALDASGDAIYVIEIASARIVDLNASTCESTGYGRHELLGRSAAVLLEGEGDDSLRETLLASLRREGTSETARAAHRRKDGSAIPVEITRRAFHTAEGQFVVCIARDISQRLRHEIALSESNERFRMVACATNDVVWDWNIANDELWWNDNYFTVLGFDRATTKRGLESWTDHIHPEDRLRIVNSVHAAIDASAPSWSGEYRFRLANGNFAHILDRGLVIHDIEGKAVRMIGAMLDISERKQVERETERRARRQEMIATFGQFALRPRSGDELVREAVSVLQAQADVVAHFEKSDDGHLVLRQIGGADGTSPIGASGPLPSGSTEQRLLDRGMALRVSEEYLRSVPESLPWSSWMRQMRSGVFVPVTHNGHANGILGIFARGADAIGEDTVRFAESIGHVLSTALQRERAEQKLAYLAQFDPLTGLPNRNLVEDRLGQTMAQSRRRNWQAAVLFIDLDRYKLVNDTLGRAAGDVVLCEVAKRIRTCVPRAEDTVGRLADHEFGAVLADLSRADDAASVAQRILDALAAPISVPGSGSGARQEVYIGANIGIAVYPTDGETEAALLRNAELAMARGKQSGANAYRFFTATMDERTAANLQMDADLRHAIERGEFQLHYQPKIDLRTGALTGLEALLRWRHPSNGLVSPARFIPLLEESGLIVPVGEWVLREACSQVRAWQSSGLDPVPVAVNLSAAQFRRGDLHEVFERILGETGVTPTHLELEVTESMVAEDPEDAVRQLKALRELGLGISVDDFGTGYSSLSYLTRLPLTALKVDRSFVCDAVENPVAASIVGAIISMARSMNLRVIAEGVETEAQAAFLRERGCDQAQGYLYARPEPAEEIAKRLAKAPA